MRGEEFGLERLFFFVYLLQVLPNRANLDLLTLPRHPQLLHTHLPTHIHPITPLFFLCFQKHPLHHLQLLPYLLPLHLHSPYLNPHPLITLPQCNKILLQRLLLLSTHLYTFLLLQVYLL